jgi:allantoate deiminase
MGMSSVRSEGGISHNPSEWSSKDDCNCGCNVLLYSAGLAGRT